LKEIKMNRESIIEKIKKLRALAGNNNSVEEVATATRLAEELIQKHQLEDAELEISFGSTEQVLEDQEALTDWKLRQTIWQNSLLSCLCQAYNCEGVLKQTKDGSLAFYAIGRPSNISTLRYQYSYFVLELTRLAQSLSPFGLKRGSAKKWYNSFYHGAVQAIGSELRRSKQEIKSTANFSALAIIDKQAREALDLKHRLYPRAGSKKLHIRNINYDAYNIGKQAGSSLGPKPGLALGVRGLLGS
jgi:hypothetical protein